MKCPIPQASSKQPDNKRTKLSDDSGAPNTIENKILTSQYESIQAVVQDVETASTLVIQGQSGHDSNTNGSATPSGSQTELTNRSRIFKKHLENFVLRNSLRDSTLVKAETHNDEESKDANNVTTLNVREDKMVLTLFGNAPRGRQLFSSLQLSAHEPKARSVIENARLPNGINASKVIPFNISTLEEKKKIRTIGDIFSPRSNLLPLERPRRSKSIKSSSDVTWIDPYEEITSVDPPPEERKGYSFSPITSGPWISYGYQPTVRYAGRRQSFHEDQYTQRGISNGKPNRSLKADEGLFRGVYSSFAPSFDSSHTVVNQTEKEQLWWSKAGAKRLHAFLTGWQEPANLQSSENRITDVPDLDDSTLEETVKSFVPETTDDETKDGDGNPNDDKDLEEILGQISDLLQTLNSYRQIRYLSTPEVSGPNNKQVPDSTDYATPSGDESVLYETLRSSLSAMISSLPPYAVSKLDGEKLAELNLSRKVIVENPDFTGTMEEDEYSMQQKQLAKMPQAPPNSNRTPTGNINASRSSAYQASPAPPTNVHQRGYAANPRIKSVSSAQPPQNYGLRQPSSIQYTPTHSPQPYHPRQAQRTPSYGQPQFPQSGTPYSQNNILQQFQRPSPNAMSPYNSQRVSSVPQASQQSQSSYQQRTQDSVYSAGLNGANGQRPQTFGTPQRHTFVNAPPNNVQPRYFQQQQQQQQQPASNFPSQAGSPSIQYSNNTAAMSYARSAAEQAALMERNKAQLAEHQRKSGTPQSNHIPGVQGRHATPNSQQNGTPTSLPGGPR